MDDLGYPNGFNQWPESSCPRTEVTEDLSPKGWNTDLVEAGDAAVDMSRRSVVKSLDSGRLEKNRRIVTPFWALKCPMPRPLFGGVSWYQGKPWLGDRSEDAVLWWGATPSYGMSIREKDGKHYQPWNWGGFPWYFQVPKLFGLLSCCFFAVLPTPGKNSPKMLKIAVFKTDFGKRWLWATPWPNSQCNGLSGEKSVLDHGWISWSSQGYTCSILKHMLNFWFVSFGWLARFNYVHFTSRFTWHRIFN